MKPMLLLNLISPNIHTRNTAANSFKYFCVKGLKIENDLRELIQALLNSMSEKDIKTRTAVLKSLNMIAYNIPNALIQHVTKEEFFLPLKEALRFS